MPNQPTPPQSRLLEAVGAMLKARHELRRYSRKNQMHFSIGERGRLSIKKAKYRDSLAELQAAYDEAESELTRAKLRGADLA